MFGIPFVDKFPYLEVLPDLNKTGNLSIKQLAIPSVFVWIGKPGCKPCLHVTAHAHMTSCVTFFLASLDLTGTIILWIIIYYVCASNLFPLCKIDFVNLSGQLRLEQESVHAVVGVMSPHRRNNDT